MLKKLLSYIWPITKTIPSELSGQLEVTWENGKKLLDSEGANYSYGSLQEVLVYGLRQIQFPKAGDCLVLGMGAGSVIKSLWNQFDYSGEITAVELDGKVIDLAAKEFGIRANDHLRIIQEDAYDFVFKDKSRYDLIIIDLFIHLEVPKKFYQIEFWEALSERLNSGGSILFNSGIDHHSNKIKEDLQEKISGFLESKHFRPPHKPNRLWVLRHKTLG